MSRFRIFLILSLLFITIATVVAIFYSRNKTAPTVDLISPTPTQIREVLAIKTLYPDPESGILGSDSSIVITFDRPINYATLSITAVPAQSFTIKPFPQNSLAVIVVPNQKWVINTVYDLMIHAGAMSTDNRATIPEDLRFHYRTGEAPLPHYDRPQV